MYISYQVHEQNIDLFKLPKTSKRDVFIIETAEITLVSGNQNWMIFGVLTKQQLYFNST
jgi:hypothetical protein